MCSSPFGPDARTPFERLFVPLKLMSTSWEPCSFNKVPDYPSTYTTNVLRKKKELIGMLECRQGFTLAQNVSWGFLHCCTPT